MKIVYKVNNIITDLEVINVFKSVGWNKNPEDILDAFNNSYYVTAYHNDTLVAFARAISDGQYYTGIYDVIVNSQYQKKGIAKEMMKMLLRKFKGTYFFLSYTKVTEIFTKNADSKIYQQECGWIERNLSIWI